MSPHSEMENSPFVDVKVQLRQRKTRSRSISPSHFRKTSGQREFYNNPTRPTYFERKNVYYAGAKRRRSFCVSNEFTINGLDSNTPTFTTQNRVIQPTTAGPVVVCFGDAPDFLQFNPFIYRGYRTNFSTTMCIKSLFWWTNETLNTWTHLLGWIYFTYFTVDEAVKLINSIETLSWENNVMNLSIVFCFQICMALSTGYHTFSCHSRDLRLCWLSYDLCGVSFSMLAIQISEIYYLFWCQNTIRRVYIAASGILFLVAVLLLRNPKFLTLNYRSTRLTIFVLFSGFGLLPCLHWVWQNGEFNTHVFNLVSQIGIMYLTCGLGLFIFAKKIPEVWFPGCVDFIGNSHQWWHIIGFLAFRHWQMTTKYFASLRFQHGCFETFSSFSPSAANFTSQSFHYNNVF